MADESSEVFLHSAPSALVAASQTHARSGSSARTPIASSFAASFGQSTSTPPSHRHSYSSYQNYLAFPHGPANSAPPSQSGFMHEAQIQHPAPVNPVGGIAGQSSFGALASAVQPSGVLHGRKRSYSSFSTFHPNFQPSLDATQPPNSAPGTQSTAAVASLPHPQATYYASPEQATFFPFNDQSGLSSQPAGQLNLRAPPPLLSRSYSSDGVGAVTGDLRFDRDARTPTAYTFASPPQTAEVKQGEFELQDQSRRPSSSTSANEGGSSGGDASRDSGGAKGGQTKLNKDQKRQRNRESSQRFRDRARERQSETKRRMDWLEIRCRALQAELSEARLGILQPSTTTAANQEIPAVQPGGVLAAQPASQAEVIYLRKEYDGMRNENENLRNLVKTLQMENETLRSGQAPPSPPEGSSWMTSGSSSGLHSRMTSMDSTYSSQAVLSSVPSRFTASTRYSDIEPRTRSSSMASSVATSASAQSAASSSSAAYSTSLRSAGASFSLVAGPPASAGQFQASTHHHQQQQQQPFRDQFSSQMSLSRPSSATSGADISQASYSAPIFALSAAASAAANANANANAAGFADEAEQEGSAESMAHEAGQQFQNDPLAATAAALEGNRSGPFFSNDLAMQP